MAARAGDRLGAAGRRAIGVRADVSAGVNLMSGAVSLLPTEDPLRRELLTEARQRAHADGRLHGARRRGAGRSPGRGGSRRRQAARGLRTLIEREFFRAYAGSEDASETIPAVAARAIPLLEDLGDDLGLAKAWWLKSEIESRAGRWGARAAALERAVEHARRSGDLREQATLVGLLAQALYDGPTPVEGAIARCEGFLVSVSGDRSLEAAIGSTLGGLRAMRGEFEEARRLWAAAETMYEELGLTFRRAARSPIPASIEMLAGEPAAAERELRWGYDKLEPMGEKGVSGTLAAFLGEAIYAQGRDDEAEAFAEIASRTTAHDDLVPQILSRVTRGKVLAKRGELQQAVQLGREALRLVEQTDFPDLHADVLLSMAEILGSGSSEDPSPLVEQAREVYVRKGNVVGAERAAQLAAKRPASA